MTRRGKSEDSRGSGHLALMLHKEFFVRVLVGKKKREYRDDTPYWRNRLLGRSYNEVHFRNGYSPKAPFMRVEVLGIRHYRARKKFVIQLGKILATKYLRREW